MEKYDVVIVGSGTSGLGAAIYCAREKTPLIAKTHIIENYPGIITSSGKDFYKMFTDHAAHYKIPIKEEEIVKISKSGKGFKIKTKKKEYFGLNIIVSTGSHHRDLNVPGEKEFANKGVSYCATCDGPLFKGKVVGVVGGADSAAKEALFLTQHVKKVYMIYRGKQIHPEPINLDLVKKKVKEGKIEIINNTNIIEIEGDAFVKGVVFDKAYKSSKKFKLEGLFIAIGWLPNTDLFKGLKVKFNKGGEIITDRAGKTNVDGIYACGDVTNDPFKQVITGVAEGVACAFNAFERYRKVKK
jgi:thioredoxin reductase (NADPH)